MIPKVIAAKTIPALSTPHCSIMNALSGNKIAPPTPAPKVAAAMARAIPHEPSGHDLSQGNRMDAGETATEQDKRRKGMPFFANKPERDRPAADQTRTQQQRAARTFRVDIPANRYTGKTGTNMK
jgi:hypothetical protein